VRVAKELGIPSILLVDGLAVGRNPLYRLGLLPRLKVSLATSVYRMLNVGGLRGTSGVERVLVMNEASREEIIRHGVDDRRVKVVGSPEYDDLARKERDVDAPERNRRLRARLGITEGRPVVLFAHQSLFLPRREEQEFIRQLMHAVRACDGVLLVKFHPRCKENPADWRAWAEQEGFTATEVVFVRDWSPSIEVVRLSSACVTVYSTVALEALVLGTPLILIQYLNTESILPYGEKYGAAIAVRSPTEFRDAIVRAVTDAETRATLRRNAQVALVSELGGFNGRSLERSSEAVLDLLRRTDSDNSGLRSERGGYPSRL
jgi:glycosyltransferase involved in cell wall biosynthesis